MVIQALPQTTVRALGANQALTNPASVVKELVDNAIDANATFVAVEIHHNTLDTIQVRDNGRGVSPEDRPLVARRYCTSKIIHSDDLKDIGGSSLGFRGEALASAAELSGSLTISTRIEGEQVAVALKIDQRGEVVGQDRASLPVGTTVKITDFIKSNPVRRQVALKNAETSLGKIKRGLQAYALARPHIRFSLRILKSKTRKDDWVYAPKADSDAADAAFKIVGAACASQCSWSILEESRFTYHAYLPRPDADARKIANSGCFISIDRRPVSNTRGTPKQIAKTFRDALKKGNPNLDDVTDPFLYLDITCPIGSYDANIEPAKDDVLFEEPSLVVEGARKLFAAVYASSTSTDPQSSSLAVEAPAPVQQVEEVDESEVVPERSGADSERHESNLLGRRELATDFAIREPWDEDDVPLNGEETRPQPPQAFRSNMYGYDEDDLDLLDARPPTDHAEDHMEELQRARKDIHLSNPFIMAKMNSKTRHPPMEALGSSDDTCALPNQLSSSPTKSTYRQVDVRESFLPTPRPSSPSPPIEDAYPRWHAQNMIPPNQDENPMSPFHAAPELQTPVHSGWAHANDNSSNPGQQQHIAPAYNYDLTSQDTAPSGTPLDAIPDSSTRPRKKPQRQSNINKPFVQPFRAPDERDQVWFDNPVSHSKRQRKPRAFQPNNGLVTQGELGDLAHDPRPLTPPRRNHDIRAFLRPGEVVGTGAAEIGEENVGHRLMQNMGWSQGEGLGKDGQGQLEPVEQVMRRGTAGLGRNALQTVSSLIERRNYGRPPPDMDTQESQPAEEDDPAHMRETGVLGGRDFVSAAEVAALQEYCSSSPEKQIARPPKRRKTSERRPLRELSANAFLDEESRPTTSNRSTTSTRRHSTRRRKSSRLPLESIPPTKTTANLILPHSTTPDSIARLAGKIDDDSSLLKYNEPAVGLSSVFSSDELDLRGLANNLHLLLIKDDDRNSAMEHEHLLFQEIRAAFTKHAQTQAHDDDDDEIMSSV